MAMIEDYCRCCMNRNAFLFDMNSVLKESDKNVSSYFSIYMNLIAPMDALMIPGSTPKTCQECSLKIEMIYEFSKSCQMANLALTEKHHQMSAVVEDTIVIDEKPEVLVCSTCGANFTNRTELEGHELDHIMEMTMFVCPLCQFNTTREQEMSEHFSEIHKILYNPKFHRKTLSGWGSEAVVHEPIVESEPPEQLTLTTHSFNTQGNYFNEAHNSTEIPIDPEVTEIILSDDEPPPSTCHICKKSLKAGESLKAHLMRSNHVRCKCGKEFSRYNLGLVHAFDHFSFSKFMCCSCSFQSKIKPSMKSHLNRIHGIDFIKDIHEYTGSMVPLHNMLRPIDFQLSPVEKKKPTPPKIPPLVWLTPGAKETPESLAHVNEAEPPPPKRPAILRKITKTTKVQPKPDLNKEMPFSCKSKGCLAKFVDRQQAVVHVLEKHLADKKYKCSQCKFETNQLAHIKTHLKNNHRLDFEPKLHHYPVSNLHIDRLIVEQHNPTTSPAVELPDDEMSEEDEVTTEEIPLPSSPRILKEITTIQQDKPLSVYAISNTSPAGQCDIEDAADLNTLPFLHDPDLQTEKVISLDSDDDDDL